jgi:site-specific recombinase XerD
LTIDEMQRIVHLELQPHTPVWDARNYFLLSFCLIGINFTDLFKLTQGSINEKRVIFNRSKTHKVYSIYLHAKAQEIINHYNLPGTTHLLPVLAKDITPIQAKKNCKQRIKTANEYLYKIATLCGIKQDITTYYARYTWANIAKSLGISKDIISEALGHSYGLAVTGIYLDNYGNEIIDAANEQVIAAVFD